MEENNPDLIDIHLISHSLTNDSSIYEEKLHAIKTFKKLFSNSRKSFSNVSLESLLSNAVLLHGKHDKDFLFSYGNSLVDFIGRDSKLDSKILMQMEVVLFELEKQEKKLLERLVKNLWQRLETTSISFPIFIKKIIPYSKKFLEEVVLDWVEGTIPTSEIDFLVNMSSTLPELFQAITTIFYQVVIESEGNCGVLELMRLFVSSVMTVCEKEQKDFLGLYPDDCRSLVPLLMVPSEIYPEGKGSRKLVTRNLVGGLLADLFFNDSKRALMLLSNYPDWLIVLNTYLDENYSSGGSV